MAAGNRMDFQQMCKDFTSDKKKARSIKSSRSLKRSHKKQRSVGSNPKQGSLTSRQDAIKFKHKLKEKPRMVVSLPKWVSIFITLSCSH